MIEIIVLACIVEPTFKSINNTAIKHEYYIDQEMSVVPTNKTLGINIMVDTD